jgi:uncharacterized protein
MVPYLKSGDYNQAILTGATSIAQFIAADSGVQLTGVPSRRQRQQEKSDTPWWLPLLIPIGIFLLVRWLSSRGRSGGARGGMRSGGSAMPWIMMGSGMGSGGWGGGFGGSSGGWGGGGGGGGGFGGFGGGMSGGGGAGGSW